MARHGFEQVAPEGSEKTGGHTSSSRQRELSDFRQYSSGPQRTSHRRLGDCDPEERLVDETPRLGWR